MAKKVKKEVNNIQHDMVEYSVSNLKVGDEIYIPDDNDKYMILDIGDPFILILNMRTNFANLYKCTKAYKFE